jgi:hypothetical protein
MNAQIVEAGLHGRPCLCRYSKHGRILVPQPSQGLTEIGRRTTRVVALAVSNTLLGMQAPAVRPPLTGDAGLAAQP